MGKIKKPFGDYNILINPFSAKLYKTDKKKGGHTRSSECPPLL